MSEKKYSGEVELSFDWKLSAKPATLTPVVKLGGLPVSATDEKLGTWHGNGIKHVRLREPSPIVFKPVEGLEIMNVFVRELKEEKK